MFLYVSLTGGRGEVVVRVELVDVNEEQDPIWTDEKSVPFPDPRAVLEILPDTSC